MANEQWPVVVIGGGAAGLMAAAGAASVGQPTLLLEKNRKLGVKILMSGGTRCNITHHCGVREIVSAFGRHGKFLHSALSKLPPGDVVQLMTSQGVATKVESTGKIFPVSNKAIDVRDALVRHATQAGAQIRNPASVKELSRNADATYGIHTDEGVITAQRVIITTGGKSYPGCGTTGDGYGWATAMGHRLVRTVPALVPILSNTTWANQLKGITQETTRVRVWQSPELETPPEIKLRLPNRKRSPTSVLAEREGSFLFTHWGFSGPSVLDVSDVVARHPQANRLELHCDFAPQQNADTLLGAWMTQKQQDARQQVGSLLQPWFPKRLADSLLDAAGIAGSLKNADLSKKQLRQLVEQVKVCRFPIQGTLGFEKAEVTSGGVALEDVDSRTMESRLQPGLFFAGEILDLDGPIGGFNFQAAFSTGWLAGLSTRQPE